MKSADGSHDLRNVKEDIAVLRQDMADLVSGLAESGMSMARRGASSASSAFSSAAECAREKSAEAHEQVRKTVSTRPVTYLALAFGVGAVVGRLMARR